MLQMEFYLWLDPDVSSKITFSLVTDFCTQDFKYEEQSSLTESSLQTWEYSLVLRQESAFYDTRLMTSLPCN